MIVAKNNSIRAGAGAAQRVPLAANLRRSDRIDFTASRTYSSLDLENILFTNAQVGDLGILLLGLTCTDGVMHSNTVNTFPQGPYLEQLSVVLTGFEYQYSPEDIGWNAEATLGLNGGYFGPGFKGFPNCMFMVRVYSKILTASDFGYSVNANGYIDDAAPSVIAAYALRADTPVSVDFVTSSSAFSTDTLPAPIGTTTSDDELLIYHSFFIRTDGIEPGFPHIDVSLSGYMPGQGMTTTYSQPGQFNQIPDANPLWTWGSLIGERQKKLAGQTPAFDFVSPDQFDSALGILVALKT